MNVYESGKCKEVLKRLGVEFRIEPRIAEMSLSVSDYGNTL